MADASLAACRDFRRLGTAIAAMIPMIATTINSSISEKPFCSFFIRILSPLRLKSLNPLGECPWRTGAIKSRFSSATFVPGPFTSHTLELIESKEYLAL
jgi:hypothetical protein